MNKTIHQAVAEYLKSRITDLRNELDGLSKNTEYKEALEMVIDEFDQLAEHIFGELDKRGLTVDETAVAPADGKP
jgi:hypothetical protein